MRRLRLSLAALTALALAGCMHRQQAYYVVDPATGRAVPVVQSYPPPQAVPAYGQSYSQPQAAYGQSYAQPPAAYRMSGSQALYSSSPAAAQQSYAQAVAAPTYAQAAPNYAADATAPPNQSARSEGRGLFSGHRFSRRTTYRTYVAPQYAAGGPYVPAATASYASVNATAPSVYTLDSGDKLRIVVFGQEGISNSYLVGADGNVNLPLVGSVPARGFTTSQLAQMISERLKQGYVREPHVSVEVEANRPFFILGEVTNPGQYPYVANMTAETAVAIAGGFSPRASKGKVQLTRHMPGRQIKGDVPLNYPLRPGDTIVVKERWF
jgi:polysaccharide export outer membrane protein